MTAASASLARAEVLAFIDDPKVWRGELEVWNEAYYREAHGEPDDVVDVEPAGAFPRGYAVESACPVCRPGAVADGARPVRCILHGGGDEAIQPIPARGCRERVMSGLVECPRCDGLEVVDADEDGRPLDDWPARDMGGRLPVAGDWRECYRFKQGFRGSIDRST